MPTNTTHNSKHNTKIGRPLKITTRIENDICNLISVGKSLATVCETLKLDYNTVNKRLRSSPDFLRQYTLARDSQADWYADEILKTIDDAPLSRDAIEKAKVRAEALKWIASKLKPKKYGDKLDLTSDGERIEQPIYGGKSLGTPRTVVDAEVIKPKQIPTPKNKQ